MPARGLTGQNHMKKILLVVLLAFTIQQVNAQTPNFDSLKRVLAKQASGDTLRFYTLSKLTGGYANYKPDSSIYYAKQAVELAKKYGDTDGVAYYRTAIAYGLYIKGNYPGALAEALPALAHIETGKITTSLANTYNLVGNIYKGQENYPKAVTYYKRCLSVGTSVNDYLDMSFSAANIAYIFERTNVLDSALYYVSKAEAYCRANNNFYLEYPLQVYGDIYIKQHDFKKALSYLQRGYALTIQNKNLRVQTSTSLSLSAYYKEVNNTDSAIYWARVALTKGKSLMQNKVVYQSAGLLSDLYASKHQPDSAFVYLKLSSGIRDSLYSTAQFNAIEAINADEDRRIQEAANAEAAYRANLKLYVLLFVIAIVLTAAFLLWRNNRNKQRANYLLQEQKEEIATQRDSLGQALEELKAAQDQLVQREKMASLGELTAGIAHEIQNPLNFVNNFSEVNQELMAELTEELDRGDIAGAKGIAVDIISNLEKVHHHGKRADGIVKEMLAHSRSPTGQKQATDLNKLADEYLRLAYHGFRVKNKNFNAELLTSFDECLPPANVIPQDIGRVMLNLFNNAFYAVQQKQLTGGPGYKPMVHIKTFVSPLAKGGLGISVSDNGIGIPDAIKEKIMQPFFTTKPTGQGTGLGLSLSYDIIVKGHGGTLVVNSSNGEGTEAIISL
jgi:two-component system NtrC family sensor kinase